jgi:hypothetical protein
LGAVFLAVCQSLRETDDGLLGRSKHLLDTGKEAPFAYYYLLFSAGDDSLIVKASSRAKLLVTGPEATQNKFGLVTFQ